MLPQALGGKFLSHEKNYTELYHIEEKARMDIYIKNKNRNMYIYMAM